MQRTTIALVLTLTLTAAACRDMGLDGNIPLDQAEHMPPKPLVQQVMERGEDPGPRLIVDGRIWAPSGQPQQMDADQLRAVGSGDGHTVYARTWDTPPFDAVFVQVQDEQSALAAPATRWLRLEPVRGRTGPLPAAGEPAGNTGHDQGHDD